MTNTTTELTVEAALKELREMFPRNETSVMLTAGWMPEGLEPHVSHNVAVWLNKLQVRRFDALTLADCMAQVRAWKGVAAHG